MSETTNCDLGEVRISVYYDFNKNVLSVTVHEARNLTNADKKNLKDLFARIILLPDGKKETLKETKPKKDNLNPVWEQTFYYTTTFIEAQSKNLKVSLHDLKSLFQKQEAFIGEVLIPLESLDMKTSVKRWYHLKSSLNMA